jgi:hypothetical protein
LASIKEIILKHDGYVTATVNGYTSRLQDIVSAATARTIAELHQKLDILPDGTIANTPANQRVLRGLDAIFEDEMGAAGFEALNKAYAGQFAGQLPFLDEIIDKIGEALDKPLPDVKDAIRAEDRKALAAQQASTVANLDTVVDTVAASAKRQALFGVAGLSAKDLAETLATAFGKTVGQAEAIADTAQVVWFRTVSDRSFQVIEKDLPEMVIRYELEGPDDKLTRPWCHKMLALTRKTPLTRAEIDEHPNGQLPNPFVTCGGWNCRHSFMVALS